MIREDLVAERIAIDSDRRLIRYIGERLDHASNAGGDPAMEEEHADDLADMLVAFPDEPATERKAQSHRPG